MIYRRKKGSSTNVWYVAVPTRSGSVKRSTGTTDKSTAKAMARMLDDLKQRRQWAALDPLARAGGFTIKQLFDAYSMNAVDAFLSRREEPDLTDLLTGWQAWLADRVKPDTARHYLVQLRTLMPEGKPFYRSELTAPAVAQWLNVRTRLVQKRPQAAKGSRRKVDPSPVPVTGSTKRKYLAAVQSFAKYLLQIGTLATNPLHEVEAPRQGTPRAVALDLRDVLRTVEAAEGPSRPLYAILYGAGVEISAALACTERDVDLRSRELRAPGTKTHSRDRVVRVADWAWPHLLGHVKKLLPGERLFAGLDRWKVGDHHTALLQRLELPHHRLHDARHFYAVRAIRAGTPYELVARQLGHADVAMVAKVYGRFAPRQVERNRWEEIAAAQDRELLEQISVENGALHGAPTSETTNAPDWERAGTAYEDSTSTDSRGGTRTRDPGIMSAVL